MSPKKATILTYAQQKEEDAEHVDNGQQSHRQRRDDLAERRHAAEEPQDAEGAEDAHDACVLVRDEEGKDGQGDDEGVELAPHVGDERTKPVRQSIDRELDGEDHGEEKVKVIEEIGQHGGRPILVCEIGNELCLHNGAHKVLSKQRGDWISYK